MVPTKSVLRNKPISMILPVVRARGVKGAAFAACDVIVEDFGSANVPGVNDGESTLRAFLLLGR